MLAGSPPVAQVLDQLAAQCRRPRPCRNQLRLIVAALKSPSTPPASRLHLQVAIHLLAGIADSATEGDDGNLHLAHQAACLAFGRPPRNGPVRQAS